MIAKTQATTKIKRKRLVAIRFYLFSQLSICRHYFFFCHQEIWKKISQSPEIIEKHRMYSEQSRQHLLEILSSLLSLNKFV